MPTDVDRAFARKRAAQAKVQTEINMLLFGLIMCLGLLFEFLGGSS
jgi:hypothetical protein